MKKARQMTFFGAEPRQRSANRGVFERPKGSGIWWINYYDADGKRHREKIGRESVAVSAYVNRQVAIREGREVAPRKPQITFRDLAEARMAFKKTRLALKSYETDEQRLKPLLAEFGDLPARSISAERIERTINQMMGKGMSGATGNRYLALLSSIFSYGVKHGKLAANPLKNVERYAESPGRVRFLDLEEEAAIRKVITEDDPDREPEFDLALQTGMRRDEQFSLPVDGVDLDQSLLTVTGKGGFRRFIPINSAARMAILKLRKLSNGSRYLCREKKREGQEDWRRWFEDAVKKAGVVNFKWHDLRHTYASRLVMSGVDLATVQKFLGHRSIITTMRYAHLSKQHQHKAAEKIAKWGKPHLVRQGRHPHGTSKSKRSRKIVQMA